MCKKKSNKIKIIVSSISAKFNIFSFVLKMYIKITMEITTDSRQKNPRYRSINFIIVKCVILRDFMRKGNAKRIPGRSM